MVMVGVVILTALLNYLQSLIWYGDISPDLLIIGTIDAILISLLVTPLVIKLILIEQKRVKDELKALAITDDLTKLNNRRGFYLLAEHLLKIASRTKSGMYLMYTDLDDFKKINDEFGHAAGDKALQEYARLLKENYRESDIVARVGGDEFVLLPVGTSKDGLDVIRNRFYKILANYNDTNDHPWTLSATIGMAYYDPENPCSLDELLKQADKAMYGGKRRNNKHANTPEVTFRKPPQRP
jgi:diguanylate cyclase (GGDEF)-like protein